MNTSITLREIQASDCPIISAAFRDQGWDKPVAQYERYVQFQESGKRAVILAEWAGEFAGYLTIKWTSEYPPFREKGIPEIVDFNVLKKFQRKGIGTCLMDEAEKRIKAVSGYAGIGFGMYKDYGPAQILYVLRGYIPDGNGLIQDNQPVKYGEKITVDDGIALCLTKKL